MNSPSMNSRSSAVSRATGFTLVEVLVAMAITALVAVVAYNALVSVSEAIDQRDQHAQALEDLDRVWLLLEQDLQQLVIASDGAQTAAATVAPTRLGIRGQTPQNSDGQQLWLQLSSHRRPRLALFDDQRRPRSDLQWVGYRLDESVLSRWRGDYELLASETWVLSGVEAFELNTGMQQMLQQDRLYRQTLLENVTGLAIRFLPAGAATLDDQYWQSEWPQAQTSPAAVTKAPIAVEVMLDTATMGRITRLFMLSPGLQ